MSKLSVPTRAVLLALVVAGTATSGCSMFREGSRLYSGSADSRPLEVPPDLDTTAASAATAGGSVTASGAQRAAAGARSQNGFVVQGERDAVYARVGEVLAGVQGLTIASRAQLLGAYDVSYGGSNFLVRVTEGEGGMFVSVVDPRGLPITGEAPVRLIETLRGALGGS